MSDSKNSKDGKNNEGAVDAVVNSKISTATMLDKTDRSESDSVPTTLAFREARDRSSAIKEFAERKWMGKVNERSATEDMPGSDTLANFLTGSINPGSSAVGDPSCPAQVSVGSTESDVHRREYEEFQHRIALAFRIQEAKVVSSRLQVFQKTHIHPRWFHFIDETGAVDEEAEGQFEAEWWTMVVYWLTFIFFMVILGFVVVSISDLSQTDFLMSRIGVRIVVAAVGCSFLCAYPKFRIRIRRRMLTMLITMYFTALIMTDVERIKNLTEMIGMYSCDNYAVEDFIDCKKEVCRSILPFLTSQCSLVATFLRLPFHHMFFLVAYVCGLYLASGCILHVSLFQENVGLAYELFCLIMAFGVMVVAARRVEVLSRYLFLRTHKDDGEALNIQSLASAPVIKEPTADDDTFFSKMIGICSKGAQAFTNKKSFMKFESLVVFGSGKLNMENISFYDVDMEFCFYLGRWEVTKKWSMITFVLVFPAFVGMSINDYFSLTQKKYCEVITPVCSPDDFVKARIIPRAVFFLAAFGVMLFVSRKILQRVQALGQVRNRYNMLLAIIIFYFSVIIMTETLRLAGIFDNSYVCHEKACRCYSMLSFVTAQFSWVLVAIRLPFNRTMLCLIIVSIVYIVSIPQGERDEMFYEMACLLLMCFCFTISAHRADVLARAHFLLEYGMTTDDYLANEVEKKLETLKGKLSVKEAE
eukprot:GEMP01008030.1.p1 GENE.GEMP01008030.1~~GEMP01008030.1.p1  ORF type:complete len:701 (+),score=118.40 GEMP01008030.1:206-2308(+)